MWADVPPDRAAAVRREPDAGPGLRLRRRVDVPRRARDGAAGVHPRRSAEQPDDLRRQFKELFAAGARSQDTGGIHAAALSDGSVLRCHAEDIGRHNAVDKVIGAALLAGLPIAGLGLLVTGRISAELAFKAARANLAWVATPSVPSTLADAIARRAGMTLIGRAVSGTPQVHQP